MQHLDFGWPKQVKIRRGKGRRRGEVGRRRRKNRQKSSIRRNGRWIKEKKRDLTCPEQSLRDCCQIMTQLCFHSLSGSTTHLCLINAIPSHSLLGNKSTVANKSALSLVPLSIFMYLCLPLIYFFSPLFAVCSASLIFVSLGRAAFWWEKPRSVVNFQSEKSAVDTFRKWNAITVREDYSEKQSLIGTGDVRI